LGLGGGIDLLGAGRDSVTSSTGLLDRSPDNFAE
jgi:hypothetical protein